MCITETGNTESGIWLNCRADFLVNTATLFTSLEVACAAKEKRNNNLLFFQHTIFILVAENQLYTTRFILRFS